MATAKRSRKAPDRTVSEIFRDEFEKRPDISYGDIARAVSAVVGIPITDQAVSGYHKGGVKKRPNLVVIAAIAEFYGLDANDLPEIIVTLCSQAHDVLAGLTGLGTPPGTRTQNLQVMGQRASSTDVAPTAVSATRAA